MVDGIKLRRDKLIKRNIDGRNSHENFLSRAKKKHGERYDYSRARYIGLRYRIIVGCPDHGFFEQLAQAHIINGQGCPACAKLKRFGPRGPLGPRGPRGPLGPRGPSCCERFDKEAFLSMLSDEQRNEYDYELVSPNMILDKVTLICPTHGRFKVKAVSHINKRTRTGCTKCGKERQAAKNAARAKDSLLSIDVFFERCRAIHGNRYGYDNVAYQGVNKRVEILCSKHGSFKQTPREHWAGSGCQKCANFATSKAENEWLDSLSIRKRQHRLVLPNKRVIVDGFDPDTNTVYEFLGDYWHGNPVRFPEGYNTRCRKSFHQLYTDTLDRLSQIREAGYEVVTIWESEWNERDKIRSRKSFASPSASPNPRV